MTEALEEFDKASARAVHPPDGIVLHMIPRSRSVPPLTDQEIMEFRQWLVERKRIVAGCPIARRAIGGSNE